MVRIFPHLECIQRDTEYLSIFSLNAGKYGEEKLQIRTLFTWCMKTKIILVVYLPHLKELPFQILNKDFKT